MQKSNSKLKRIIFITSYFPPSSFADATRIYPLYTRLKESGNFEVRVYTDEISKNHNGVYTNFFKSPNSSQGLIRRVFQEILLGCELFIKLFLVKADLVIITSPPFITSAIAIVSCVLKGQNYCFDVRDIYPSVYIKANLIKENSIFTKILISLEKFCYRHASFVTTVSPGLKNEINLKSAFTKCVLLPNGFSEKIFSINDNLYPEFTVVFHGNIGRFQNIELVIEVARLIEEINPLIKFLVIGDGPKDTYLKTHNFPNLHYLGRLETQEVADIISKCHLGLSFRSNDRISIYSTPVKVYEYIGVSIPILITPFESEGSQLVENLGIGVRFSNEETQKIVETILLMEKDKNYYDSFKTNLIKIRHQFSREKQADIFLNLIQEL